MSLLINNAFYDELGNDWYERDDHPVALLRAEGILKERWISERLGEARSLLDIACGGGLLSNALARGENGLKRIVGMDCSEESIRVAKLRDSTGRVEYRTGDALTLPFHEGEFEAVTLMDFLEHVERPQDFIREAARVLKPGGKLFFHTFNRSWIAKLLVIHGVEWFVQNTPERMHVFSLFVKPSELSSYCSEAGLLPQEWAGIRPVFFSRGMWKLLSTRRVSPDFRFTLSRSLQAGYLGYAIKKS